MFPDITKKLKAGTFEVKTGVPCSGTGKSDVWATFGVVYYDKDKLLQFAAYVKCHQMFFILWTTVWDIYPQTTQVSTYYIIGT